MSIAPTIATHKCFVANFLPQLLNKFDLPSHRDALCFCYEETKLQKQPMAKPEKKRTIKFKVDLLFNLCAPEELKKKTSRGWWR